MNQIQSIKKSIKKRDVRQQEIVQKEYRLQLIIPKNISLNQYFRTKQNIQFALSTFNDNTLGELGINIFSVGYQVQQTEIQQQQLVYHFQARDFQLADITTIFQMLDLLKLESAKNNLQKYLQRYEKIQSLPFSTEQQIQEVQEYITQYPFECYTFRHNKEESIIIKYTHNMKFLDLMGINTEMLEQYLSQTKTLPCAIRVINYLETWQQVFEAVSNDKQDFEMEIQNYNGNRFYIKIKQMQLFQLNENELYGYLYWIYMTNPNQQIAIENYQKELEKIYPKPKQCTYKQIR